jgi:hypothetical protein
MALTPGTDTFATLLEANTYHEGRPSAEMWAGYDDQKREACLRAAFDRITAACKLDFDPATEPVPQMVKNAQCELALQVSKLEEIEEISGSEVTALEAGPVKFKFQPGSSADGVTNLIKSWLARAGCSCDWSGGTGSSSAGSSGNQPYTVITP